MKLIYLARRKPGFTPDEFTCRWRLHGARGMQQSLGDTRSAMSSISPN